MGQPVQNSNPEISKTTAETPVPIISSAGYSSNLSRFAAYIVDSIILGLIGTLLTLPLVLLTKSDSQIFSFLPAVIGIFYFIYFHSKDGQTVGMKILGIKIINEDGSNLDLKGASIRYLLWAILTPITIGIAPLWALFSSKKQTLYDLISKTIYVAQDEKQSRAKWIVGGYCCCGPILVGLGLAALFSLGIANSGAFNQLPGMGGSVPKATTTKLPTSNSIDRTQPFQPKTIETTTTVSTTKEVKNSEPFQPKTIETTTTISTTNEVKNSEFYKACARSAPMGVDFSAYCECATKEFESGQTDVNTIVNSCKSYLQK